MYFVGKLFERIIQEHGISHFKYLSTLRQMCQRNPSFRIQSFSDVDKEVKNDQFFEIDFTKEELETYRNFSELLFEQITKIESNTQYAEDIGRITAQLNDVYRSFMLEEMVPDAAVVLNCFVTGNYYYRKSGMLVADVKNFLRLLKTSTDEKKRIILSNLHRKLDALPHYPEEIEEDDIPF